MPQSQVHPFTFNIIEENTYIIADNATRQAAIVDCGCMNAREEAHLQDFITEHNLTPTLLIFTHLHFDHTWGLNWAASRYGLTPMAHPLETEVTPKASRQFALFGVQSGFTQEQAAEPQYSFIREGDTLTLGSTTLHVLFVPGHTAGHVAFYNPADGYVFTGDALFAGNIGRADLEGGDLKTLISHIKQNLLTLPADTVVYPGHGPATTIGAEAAGNPYLQPSFVVA